MPVRNATLDQLFLFFELAILDHFDVLEAASDATRTEFFRSLHPLKVDLGGELRFESVHLRMQRDYEDPDALHRHLLLHMRVQLSHFGLAHAVLIPPYQVVLSFGPPLPQQLVLAVACLAELHFFDQFAVKHLHRLHLMPVLDDLRVLTDEVFLTFLLISLVLHTNGHRYDFFTKLLIALLLALINHHL